MFPKARACGLPTLSFLLFSGAAYAQISAIAGDVIGADGQPARGAQILIERQDMTGTYRGARTDKNGHYIYNGLPLGIYKVSVLIDGQTAGVVDTVRTKVGDPTQINFDLSRRVQQQAMQLGPVYVSSQNSGDRLRLNGDNTFSLREGGQSFSGTYSVTGATLTLHIVQLQKDVDIEIRGNNLIVNGDETWVPPVAGAETPSSGDRSTTDRPVETRAAPHYNPPMLNPAQYRDTAPETFKVEFATTKGVFVVEVHRSWAPFGADRFYNLVKGGYFDGGPFYRVKSGFMVQFGFSPNPAVSKAWDKATIKDDPVTQSNKRGFLTFAKTGAPNSRSTHLFINSVDNSFLDGQGFAPFGFVVLGMDVVNSFFSGYGDTDQSRLRDGGIAYVQQNLPNLDLITSAQILQ